MNAANSAAQTRPQTWHILLALALVYLSWGTTYLAIHEGVKTLPPGLFGGVRLTLAGLVLLAYLLMRGQFVLLPARGLYWTALVGILLFVFGNGLISLAEKTVPSGMASVLVATTPLWMAVLEVAFPWGERLTWRGWLGLLAGLLGVLLLWLNRLRDEEQGGSIFGYTLVLGSAAAWALGSFVSRYRRSSASPFVLATYQMILGGLSLTAVGLAAGEARQLRPESFTPHAVFAFFYLLVVGSLIGFVAYTWLLGHVSTALAGTYAYVNPVVALLAAVVLDNETVGWPVVAGMGVILVGVALVRQGGVVKRTRLVVTEAVVPPAQMSNGAAPATVLRQPSGATATGGLTPR
jgi:drug/metabolite transporter (DMT)-like permease